MQGVGLEIRLYHGSRVAGDSRLVLGSGVPHQMNGITYGLVAASFFCGVAGSWVFVHFGTRIGLEDIPGRRSSHSVPTPKGGGLGIVVAFVFVCLILGVPLFVCVPCALIAIIGFISDRKDLPPIIRLCLQFAVALALLIGSAHHQSLTMPWAVFFISMWCIYIVGTANFYNFMDGIDGIAGITSVVGFGLIGLWTFLYGENVKWAVLAFCIAISSSGFLIFNLPKAKVFMGDISSTFLGFLFAAFVFFFSTSPLATLCLFSFLLPFYVDELTTMAVRIRDGENLTVAHRRHVYQLLANEKGIAHWKVSMGYGVVQLMVGLSILFLYSTGIVAVASLLVLFFAALVFVSFYVRTRIESSGGLENA